MTLAGIVVSMMLAIYLGTKNREFRLKQMAFILILTLVQVFFVAFSLYREDKIPQLEQSSLVDTP
jgi:multisubunit Na+/H+ antiporter MnhC subunit